jgi:hypothetical protein
MKGSLVVKAPFPTCNNCAMHRSVCRDDMLGVRALEGPAFLHNIKECYCTLQTACLKPTYFFLNTSVNTTIKR